MSSSRFYTQVSKWQQSLSDLPKTLGEDALSRAAEKIEKDIKSNFSTGADPYGVSWTPRKVEPGHPIMDRSGTLKNSYRFSVKSGTLSVQNTAPYSGFHQNGTDYLPQRLVLPKDGVLPESWFRIIIEEIERAFEKEFK